jgi:hypothetical protein
MNELSSLLTNVTLIATLIAVLFGVASLVIHARRKKHQLALQHRAAHPEAALSAAPVAKPEAALAFKMVAPTAPPPAPAGESENLVYDTRPTSSPLFKRLGRVGGEQVPPANAPEVAVPHEQKSAWE